MLSLDEIDQQISGSLRQIAENMDLDHVTVGEATPDGQDDFSSYHYSLMAKGPLLTRTLHLTLADDEPHL